MDDDGPGPVVEAHTVRPEDLPVRVDRFGPLRFARLASRSAARKAARRGDLRVDGEVWHPSRFLAAGQRVTLHLDRRPPPKPWDHPLDVCFQDDALAVVVKPPGIPTSGNRWRTLQNALPGVLGRSPRPDALPFPRPVHRLDTRTSGLVAVARTSGALMALSEAFRARRVHKRYLALVCGRLDGEGVVDAPVDGRTAITRWEAAAHVPCLTTGWLTLVSCWPHTGRTHQIRRHLAGLGTPIVGDDLYGRGRVLRGKGLFLWAVGLRLPHPDGGDPVSCTWEPPPKLQTFMAREERRYRRRNG